MKVLVDKIQRFLSDLKRPFVGRDEEAEALTLGLMTGEHVLFIGEPGTAKSALARRAALLVNARFFKYLLTRFTEPDELFGPLDIKALREGKYVRITTGRLPEAEIAFIDEVFNANSAILNTLLTIMNERVIYDGYTEIKTPLWSLISSSNSVPDEPELQAIYDRFLIRQFVKPVGEDKWASLLQASWRIEQGLYESAEPVLSMSDLRSISQLVFQVDLSGVIEPLLKLYAVLEDQGIHVTDRRKGKALKVIAAKALLEGRLKALEEDLFVLKFIVPRDSEEANKVYATLTDEIRSRERVLRELDDILANVREAKAFVEAVNELDPRLLDYLRALEKAREKVERLVKEASDEVLRKKAVSVQSEIAEVLELIKTKLVM